MRIDIEYIKNLLEVVLDHDKPDFRIDHKDIAPLWRNDDEKLDNLVFHMEILKDQGLIENASGSGGIGFRRMGNGGFTVSVIPLRLTAKGHQFAADLSKPGVIEKLKTSFKDSGPSEVVKVAFSLGAKVLEKKLEDALSG
ncbi:DUF2513 domain-containing protein [Mariprofundus ferrooxydans]|uniref:DUF2513 domain-containing protein n=1 Tax=Mariprofundus ferrooxydans TaxID=314344 RepID=UPI000382ED78|nr:DUF2513 domain-containing protein [Mariprofundus ferrooxydans]